jgi:hypothetical protein
MHTFYAMRTKAVMNPLHPAVALRYDQDQTAYVLFKTSEARTRPTRVFTSFGVLDGVRVGTAVNLVDDQTGERLGEYKVVGIHDFTSGEMAGDIPNISLPHCVAK